MYSVVAPILSEKTTSGMEKGLYVLEVITDATRASVKKDLKALYDVDAIKVRILNLPAKIVRFKGSKGVRNVRRKAYVQLKAGQVLPGFEIKKEKEAKTKQVAAKAEETK